jgi:type II secretory pathway component GspD/PulD (secretin)
MRVKDGESIVIGGLKRTDVTKSVVKVPLLGDIPILGRLFQTTTDSKSDSEIIIVVTPKITTRLAGSQETLPGIGGP